MEIKKFMFILFVMATVTACSNEQKDQKDALLAEVMAVHDEVMPKMGDLRRMAKELLTKADSLEALSDEELSVQASSLREGAKKIDDAYEGMMEWMRQFEVPDNEAPIAEVLAYLIEQKEKVDKVREDMRRSLEEGKALR